MELDKFKSKLIEDLIHAFNEDEMSIEVFDVVTRKWRSPVSLKDVLQSMIRTIEDKECIRVRTETVTINEGDKVIFMPTGVHAVVAAVYNSVSNYFRYKVVDENGFHEYAREGELVLDTEEQEKPAEDHE